MTRPLLDETLYDFIERTLVCPVYALRVAGRRYEQRLFLGLEPGPRYFEPSFVRSHYTPRTP